MTTTDGDDPMPAPPEPAWGDTSRRLKPRSWFAAVVGVLILPMLVAATITFSTGGAGADASNAAAARLVSAADMESEYGIRVDLVAVIAGGGLVNLQFTVIDKEKAAHIFHEPTVRPELFVEASGAVLRAPKAMAHKMTLLDGASYFMLFPNSGGAVQRGVGVSVVIDGIRLAAIDAQS